MKVLLVVAALALAMAAVPGASAEPDAPCEFGAPPRPGFDCSVAGLHCAFFIWVDLNPPNPTFDCVA